MQPHSQKRKIQHGTSVGISREVEYKKAEEQYEMRILYQEHTEKPEMIVCESFEG